MFRPIASSGALVLFLSSAAQADQVITDDLIVTGNICAGENTCQNGESFGATDIKIKGSIPEIQFHDTTSGDSIWTMTVDDTSSGVNNGFSIKNESLFRYPLVIDEEAPSNALFISDDGNIGMRTSIPQSNLHIVDTGFFGEARLRLEENTGTPYIWDLRGNSSGFYLYDATTLRLPFQVRPGAPSSSIDIDSDGNIGMGTSAPAAPVHVRRTDNSARVLVEDTGASGAQELFKLSNNGGSYFTFENAASGTTWFFTHEDASPNRFIIADGVADGPEMTLTADGDLTIPGQLFTGGSCAAGCDRVFDADYPLPTIAEQAAMMRDLKHLPNVGPTPEDGPFNITAMTGGMLNELEKAHLYIAELEERLTARDDDIAAMKEVIKDQQALSVMLVARLEALETAD
ncbi:hypothetical protein ACOXXX_18255 [Thalassococcus sp. BH17M4-6]|uniref:hypothetical protein n=1 Tax=Thalassococcus sp. BH17M4-6 TaxID=3413148 RepID=UPI003BBD8B20